MRPLAAILHALPYALLAAAIAAAPPAAGQDGAAAGTEAAAPEQSALPEPRPADLETSAEAIMADPETRVPEDDPVGRDARENEVAVIDEVAVPVWQRLEAPRDVHRECLAALRDLGAAFEEVAGPITDEEVSDCGIARPVEVSEIVPGVALNPDAVMRCETALALAGWVSDFVQPAARLLPERGEVTVLEHGSTYVCRRRNNAPDGKISEHGFGNAIDVMGFRFETGEPIAVEPREREGTFAEAFQDAVRSAACLHFATVLGPGTDAAHDDHLHLDVKERRGDFRLCQ